MENGLEQKTTSTAVTDIGLSVVSAASSPPPGAHAMLPCTYCVVVQIIVRHGAFGSFIVSDVGRRTCLLLSPEDATRMLRHWLFGL